MPLSHFIGLHTRQYVGIILFFGLLLLLTWGIGQWYQVSLEHRIEAEQYGQFERTVAEVEAAYRTLQVQMLAEAESLAEAPPIQTDLQQLRHEIISPLAHMAPQSTAYLQQQTVPRYTTRAVYNTTGQLVTWRTEQGSPPVPILSLPAPTTPRFTLTEIPSGQRVLALVYPLENRLGYVYVSRVIRQIMPFENKVLQSYDFHTGLAPNRTLAWYPEREQVAPRTDEAGYALTGIHGEELGWMVIGFAGSMDVLREAEQRVHIILQFWVLLLLLWIVWTIWRWHNTALKQADGFQWAVVGRFLIFGSAFWGIRYLLLAWDIPADWFQEDGFVAQLFDPTKLATDFGSGLARSIGDLVLSSLFWIVYIAVFMDFVYTLIYKVLDHREKAIPFLFTTTATYKLTGWRWVWTFLGVAAVLGFFILVGGRNAGLHFYAVSDSTLNYLTRENLLAEPLVLTVLMALLLNTIAYGLAGVGLMWALLTSLRIKRGVAFMTKQFWGLVFLPAFVFILLISSFFSLQTYFPFYILIPTVLLVIGYGGWILRLLGTQNRWTTLFRVRGMLGHILLVALLSYPLLYHATQAQLQEDMQEAAEDFVTGADVRSALERLLLQANTTPLLHEAVQAYQQGLVGNLDAATGSMITGSLLASFGDHQMHLALFDTTGTRMGQYTERPTDSTDVGLAAADFAQARTTYETERRQGFWVSTTALAEGALMYTGVIPLRRNGERIGWLMARTRPNPVLFASDTPFPQVLVPAGFVRSSWPQNISLSEFRDAQLMRSYGPAQGRARVPSEIVAALDRASPIWRTETVRGTPLLSYYERVAPVGDSLGTPRLLVAHVPQPEWFDHIFNLLRLLIAGAFLGTIFYAVGLFVRRKYGQLPAVRLRFRDKLLDGFLSIGLFITIVATLVGQEVVQTQSRQTIQNRLRQNIQQIEGTVRAELRPEESIGAAIQRLSLETLATRLGLDLNRYNTYALTGSSRPQLAAQGLIQTHLPISVYQGLFYEGYQEIFEESYIGNLKYLTGYKLLTDQRGAPIAVIGIPTLLEQDFIQAEQTRTVAYLFSTFALVLVIGFLGATGFSNALTAPLARIRSGLRAVAEGRFDQPVSVETRDELGDLVRTFNDMQAELDKSQKALAQKEREGAWSEMARQVAHEIKNPLTPMRLSIQHLQRAFRGVEDRSGAVDPGALEKYRDLHQRITARLTEQIDSLARIANEFSMFARLPRRRLEVLDLNQIMENVAELLETEPNVEIELDLFPRPLMVEADSEELTRIYINLLKNAFQAMPTGGTVALRSVVQVTSGGAGARNWAFSTVSDTGTGIPPDLRDKIFQPNFSTKTSGMGLGLAIVKKHVEDLSGEIGFETEEDVGTTFWIRLPLQRNGSRTG